MPVEVLFVEGALDREVLFAVLQGSPALEYGWSKNQLAPLCRRERRRLGNARICYLRDRDFDYDPPDDASRPTIDREDNDGSPLGWRWCRHEIENYLLDPRLVSAALSWNEADYTRHLAAAAHGIRHYQAARWVIGTARRSLPPSYNLTTRPSELQGQEMTLPQRIGKTAMLAWAKRHIAAFRKRANQSMAAKAINDALTRIDDRLTEHFLDSPENALMWCSGKDLLAALQPWLQEREIPSAGHFRAVLRDWIRDHPDAALALLPEWDAFVRLLRQ